MTLLEAPQWGRPAANSESKLREMFGRLQAKHGTVSVPPPPAGLRRYPSRWRAGVGGLRRTAVRLWCARRRARRRGPGPRGVGCSAAVKGRGSGPEPGSRAGSAEQPAAETGEEDRAVAVELLLCREAARQDAGARNVLGGLGEHRLEGRGENPSGMASLTAASGLAPDSLPGQACMARGYGQRALLSQAPGRAGWGCDDEPAHSWPAAALRVAQGPAGVATG